MGERQQDQDQQPVPQVRNEPSMTTATRIADALDLDQVIWPMGDAVHQYPSKTSTGRSSSSRSSGRSGDNDTKGA